MRSHDRLTQSWDHLVVDMAVDKVDEAKIRASYIKSELGSIAESRDSVLHLVECAKEARDHELLGYPSWTAYVAAEFGSELAELRRDDRRDVVAVLSETGMSTRAIASVVGVSNSTVHEDIKVIDSTVRRSNSRPATVTSLDGRERPATQPKVDARRSRRRALPVQYRDAVYELDKAVARLVRLTDDDRFAQHRPDLAYGTTADLARIGKSLWTIRKALTDGEVQ
jgi:hypothetical protein